MDSKILIRSYNESDAETFYTWYHDPRMSRFFRGYTHGMSMEQCKVAPTIFKYSVLMGILQPLGEPVGAVTLAPIDRVLPIYNVGGLIDPDFRGRGYMVELAKQGIDWAFNKLNAHKLVIKCLPDNTKMLKDAEDYGFILEGISRRSCFLDGRVMDEVVYSLLKSEYKYG